MSARAGTRLQNPPALPATAQGQQDDPGTRAWPPGAGSTWVPVGKMGPLRSVHGHCSARGWDTRLTAPGKEGVSLTQGVWQGWKSTPALPFQSPPGPLSSDRLG